MKVANKAKGKPRAKYDRESTKRKLVNAVGKIIAKEGYHNIKVNNIEKVSGVSKKSIYDYFGGLDGLVSTYLKQVDYWKDLDYEAISSQGTDNSNVTAENLFNILNQNLIKFSDSKEMQKIVLWGISERNATIRSITDEREQIGNHVFRNFDTEHHAGDLDLRAAMAIFISSIYYMLLHSENNGSTMCGIDFSTQEGKQRILSTMKRILVGSSADLCPNPSQI